MGQLDYLLIGHMTRDLTPEGEQPGGTVTYAGRAATALGCQTAVLTSAEANYAGLAALTNGRGMQLHNVPAPQTTTFENVYTAYGREQTVHAVANRLLPTDLPSAWSQPRIVHLAPVLHEVDPAWFSQFPNSLIGVTPQGWLRNWQANGRVQASEWAQASQLLPLADVVILSEEDLPSMDWLEIYAGWSKLLLLTCGAKGCWVVQGKTAVIVPTITVDEVDPTGAGDLFAAAYFIRYHQTADAIESAYFANFVAAHSVTKRGIDDVEQMVRWALTHYQSTM